MAMHQRWTLHVEQFARFQQADIELRPLTLFVGENNSGKSYMATLLWGVLALGRTLFPSSAPATKTYKACQIRLSHLLGAALNEAHHENRQPEISLTGEDQQYFIDWFNELLQQHRNKLAMRLFGNDAITIGRLSLRHYQRHKPLRIKLETLNPSARISARGEHSVQLPLWEQDTLPKGQDQYRALCMITWKLVAGDISVPLFGPRSTSRRSDGEPLFLPASRTGFMLTYRSLVGDALSLFDPGLSEEDGSTASEFTLPIVRFLQALAEPGNPKGARHAKLAHWLERELLKGQVKQSTHGALPTYHYLPEGQGNRRLPMYLTSSLVAELTPIVHFLKHKPGYRSLIIEEPEAHLHPKAQRLMARALVRLVNAGLPVMATTHGDTLFQQLNNLAALHTHPQRSALMQQLGYEKAELLKPDDVAAYQFRREGTATHVNPLEQTELGMVVSTFNEPLSELFDEVMRLQDTAFKDESNGTNSKA
ncbi:MULTISPECIES: AAA family ATPase [unclassified Ectothiorhodospira]|uniref:AAA family ATPase n=1 Tax=unclassified Ectothiorhodospira TaxID=2684909 RepID=UPI001EE7C820|nr:MULTISPECIES: AAA family ATPase [unclassified Ectothiorhodospira]MCG5516381.1 ATP-binding protein [Ectothiorhodospira sp. 9100]MCG5519369.1 ATP-binding protein [Ectothiorhodospira sp. 9905]